MGHPEQLLVRINKTNNNAKKQIVNNQVEFYTTSLKIANYKV